MLKKRVSFTLGVFLLFVALTLVTKAFFFQTSRQIVLTIDDLPIDFNNGPAALMAAENIKNSLIKYKAPAIGFVIANRINSQHIPQLELFLKNGFMMGSHTYSHPNLNKISAQQYIEDLALADKILEPYMTKPLYFRYPYLAKGKWGKKRAVQDYLHQHHYIIAPVTIDSRDFIFNLSLSLLNNDPKHPGFAALKKEYLDYIWQQTLKRERVDKWLSWSLHSKKQILLLHANLLNSYLLDSVLQMYQSHGYRFISINEALTS